MSDIQGVYWTQEQTPNGGWFDSVGLGNAARTMAEAGKRLQSMRDRCPGRPALRSPVAFNESDCGGAFDGFTVSSDADPGL
jgi:hypothetical protein